MSKHIVTIHQPDLMPWIGFFIKVWRADVFVILDHTTNRPQARNWIRRVKLACGGRGMWISIPVKRSADNQFLRIDQMHININNHTKKIFRKYIRSIQLSYTNAAYYEEFFPLLEKYFQSDACLLKQRNVEFIMDVLELLNIKTEIYFSSEMDCKHSANELNLEIVKRFSGTHYLCGDGASGYQDDLLFEENGVELIYNNFVPIEYNQCNTSGFIPGLSILDALMNIGASGVKRMIHSYGKL